MHGSYEVPAMCAADFAAGAVAADEVDAKENPLGVIKERTKKRKPTLDELKKYS